MHKVISQTTFHLKGSGWYVTDYANSKQQDKGGEKSEKKKDSTSGSKGSCASGRCPASSSS